jgi:Icc-related predicted phosphoesterase
MSRLRLFFATDLHGSDKCFRKFLNTPKVYGANVIIIGGDLTGKAIVPIITDEGIEYANYMGQKVIIKNRDQEENLIKEISDSGYYPLKVSQKEYEELSADKKKLDEVFLKLMKERLESWIKLAEEKLSNSGVKVIMNAGNDDALELDTVLDSSSFVIHPEGKVLELDGYEMISTGYANVTPWHAPRDIPEEELEKKIEDMASRVKNMEKAIFNIHPPPYNTGLDMAPKVDENLRPVALPGTVVMVPVGSVAVRKMIEKYQPMLGLHGHVHESRGAKNLGRTLIINPGSDYPYGILRGAIINLEDGKLKSYMLTTG